MKMTLKTLDSEMRYQFGEAHSRIDRLSLNMEAMDKKFEDKFEGISTELRCMRENMDSRFENIEIKFENIESKFENMDGQFSRVTADIVAAISPWMNYVENWIDGQGKRISALEKDNRA